MKVSNVFIVVFAIIKLISGEDVEKELQSPSLESRLHLHSFYSSIPQSKDIELFVEYALTVTNITDFNGKVVEFDALKWVNGRQTIHHKLPYLISNPALRTPHISADWCSSNDFFKLGFRIHQTHREFGLPYHVKCATCHPIIEGLNMIYFLYPERDFTQAIAKLSIGSRDVSDTTDYCTYADCEQAPRVTNFQDYLRVNDLNFGKWSRWNGEYGTTDEERDLLGRPDGELAIHAKTPEGYTTMCGMELNGEIISSNVFVNGDVISDNTNPTPSFTYGSYESLKLIAPSFENTTMNLELFVSWDPWGCCSACCCPPAICGHDYQSSSDCDNVFSARTRVGHLSIRKISKEPIILEQHADSLNKMVSIPPYTLKGIPLFSSLLAESAKLALKEIKEIMIPMFLAANNASGYVFRTGMFIESESCKLNEQKNDCSKWAQCHNISLSEIRQEVSEMTSDSCQQVQFVDVLVGVDPLKVRVNEHDNLRIRMNPEVHDMDKTAATWRVNLRKPKKYEKSRPCILQGIVQRNNEILILDFSSFDLKVDLILNSKQKVRISFVNSRKVAASQRVNYSILYWAAAIVVFLLLLITSVILMHREKTRRLESRIKAKELHT